MDETQGSTLPDLEKDWWLEHIGQMAEHYKRVYERHETRARYVLAALAVVIAGLKFGLDIDSLTLNWLQYTLFCIMSALLLLVIMILLFVMSPLRGSRFFDGSLSQLIHRWAINRNKKFEFLDQILGLKEFSDLAPFPLSKQYKDAEENEVEARTVLSNYLQGEFRTELSWWIFHNTEHVLRDKWFDIRRRQIFWYWANKEASNQKAILLELAMSILSVPLIIVGIFFAISFAL